MRWLISIPLLILLSGCADFGYYWHTASGHLAIMDQRADIEDLLAAHDLDPDLRDRLLLVKDIRRFSIEKLDLPANGSYRSYVELQRPYVLQNLFAAPEFSTRLHQWCYPVAGCASYRGYYDEARLLAYIEQMRAQGLEVHVGKVSAYSTLGWFDDPVLSSFIDWPEHRLAGLLFHELTHQQLYVDGDTTFNESLASAVQQVGTELWLQARRQEDALREYARWLRYREEVIELIVGTRARLGALYAGGLDVDETRERKVRQFAMARVEHAAIAARHGVSEGFSDWFAGDLNNAKIGSVAAYNSRVAAFVFMLEDHAKDFAAFYRYVEKLAALDKRERDACLDAWQREPGSARAACAIVGA